MTIFNELIRTAGILIEFLIYPLPVTNPEINSTIQGQLSIFIGYINNANYFFPVDTFAIAIGFVFVVESATFLWKFIRWLLSILTIGIIK